MGKSKLCLIIGAGKGISYSVAKKFGDEGFAVALVARTKSSLDTLAQMLSIEDIEVYKYVADAGDFEQLQQVIDTIKEQHGAPDILVYNAAVWAPGLPSATPPDKLVDDFKVNVAGALASVQQVVPEMKNTGGTIILTGGGLAHYPSKDAATLSIGKAGIWSLANILSQELSPTKIKVYTVTVSVSVNEAHADKIADKYWELYITKPNEVEHFYK